ncbi:hypothetical protein D8M04_14945 [Oceanobacillus piezotolerans]|uniref:YwdI family protein n=1 Tax=Oceanobacillus piezotolerans TaxID=2448030 RepID=A0A498D8H8_9BACI|nr:YwdI family protein [Oceanobacillus piezotolerans]RLL42843.1 hypothetical protein D8M04_14945 [Oceanobacillus piezotolerans]
MAVSNNTIINKMIAELQKARELEHQEEKVIKHIENVRLLCDLFLEEDTVTRESSTEITQTELKAMLGEKGTSQTQSNTFKRSYDPQADDANGSSIFDF